MNGNGCGNEPVLDLASWSDEDLCQHLGYLKNELGWTGQAPRWWQALEMEATCPAYVRAAIAEATFLKLKMPGIGIWTLSSAGQVQRYLGFLKDELGWNEVIPSWWLALQSKTREEPIVAAKVAEQLLLHRWANEERPELLFACRKSCYGKKERGPAYPQLYGLVTRQAS